MLGARIAALRRRAGLSQAKLAQRLQISASAMGMYEQGRREPSGEVLVALARELEVTTDFLLTGCTSLSHQEPVTALVAYCVDAAEKKLANRPDKPFTRQELATLFAALLLD